MTNFTYSKFIITFLVVPIFNMLFFDLIWIFNDCLKIEAYGGNEADISSNVPRGWHIVLERVADWLLKVGQFLPIAIYSLHDF